MIRVNRLLFTGLFLAVMLAGPGYAQAAGLTLPNVSLNVGAGGGSPAAVVASVRLLVLLSVLTFVPAILLMTTSFTRIIIVLSFLRSALGTQTTPPSQVLIGLALFLTFFIMAPVYNQVNAQAVQPYLSGRISQAAAEDAAAAPLRSFMLRQTRKEDLGLFVTLAKLPTPVNTNTLPLTVVIPAFITSELKTAFQMGFLIYIPFLVIDIVVASILQSMGMFMLPPVIISLPFKILLFVMVDGWYLVVKSLVESFH
ncbi:MAG: flagellar type III secretion system pore protein FliP [Peptococcaceae bacterium]|jgi:flagellar biosynthetic protein FliP|nr:flagellar type III secretion system pore protein FliP [Peptococcaceae bacterium]